MESRFGKVLQYSSSLFVAESLPLLFKWDILVGLLHIPKCTHSNTMHDGKIYPSISLYCSECIDDGPCTHHCCKIWLTQRV